MKIDEEYGSVKGRNGRTIGDNLKKKFLGWKIMKMMGPGCG